MLRRSVKAFLIRHGDADAEIPDGLDDDARSLVARAREALPAHFAALTGYFGPVDAIFTSPLVRAVQTATLLAQALHFKGPLKAHRALFPDAPVAGIEALLDEQGRRTVLLIGHQPSIGAAAAYFLGRPTLPKAVSPGTVIGLEHDEATRDPRSSRLICYAQQGQPVLESFE